MALTTDKNKITYQLDGTTTAFTFDFPIIEDTDLQVWVYDTSGNKTLLTLNTDYTVATTDTGGTVTLNNAYETGYTLLIYREVPYTQDTVYPENSPFPAKSHEKALDKLTMETQQLAEKVGRALLADTITGDLDVDNNRIINLANPKDGLDACNYQTALGLVSGTISVHDLTDKGSTVDGDEVLITDSASNYDNKKITMQELKNFIYTTMKNFDYIETTDPTATVNPTKQYATWINTTTGVIFVCTDNTADTNVWKELTLNDLSNVDDTIILDKLKNVDGSGSGLDTDLIRGLPGDFTASLANPGYQKLPTGLIIQWGISPLIAIGTTATITFPIAFPTAVLNAQATDLGGGEATSVGIYSLTTTAIELQVPSTDTASRTYYYMVIGY